MQECYTDIHSIIKGNLIWTGGKTNFKKKDAVDRPPTAPHRPHTNNEDEGPHADLQFKFSKCPPIRQVREIQIVQYLLLRMQTPCVRCIFRPRPLTNNTVRSLFVGPRPFWIGIIRKISKSQLRSVSALRAKTVRKPHGLETTRARYSFLNFGSVPSCALFGLVLVFWHRFDGSWCYCGLLGFHERTNCVP